LVRVSPTLCCAVCFMLVVSCAVGAKSAIYECLVVAVIETE